jgi:type 1 glutamine amidotransferase
MKLALLNGAALAAAMLCLPPEAGAQPAGEPFRLLVFSKTTLYRHASITNGIAALKQLGAEHDFTVTATEDSGAFTPANLAGYRVIVFLSTSGDILNDGQQGAFQQWLEGGGGFVGIHAAVAGKVATEGAWDWYGELFCTGFRNHPANARATIHVEDRSNPSTAHLPAQWVRYDEWYNFTVSPRGKARVLARLDETTYPGGTMGNDHPVAWCRRIGRGRLWYTALGHTEASYQEPDFLKHLRGGIQLVAGIKPADFAPNPHPQSSGTGASP